MYLLYNFIIFLFIIIYIGIIIYQKLKGNYTEGVKEKFSFIPEDVIKDLKNEDVIWIQASSVGEVMATEPLINKLKEKFPDKKILLSTMTDTGRKTAKNLDGVEVIYFPLDFIFIVRRVLKLIKPEIVILIETEIWPNFIREAKKLNAKVMVMSGRLSDDSINKYKKIKAFFKKTLQRIDHISVQSDLDKKRFIDLGASQSIVSVEGNIKFDKNFTDNGSTKKEIKDKFKINKDNIIFVAGSTHDNEEEKLVTVYNQLKDKYNNLTFLIAPRYIDRAKNIKKLYKKMGIKCKLRTSISDENYEEDVVIVDTLGELVSLYKIADIVFIGGSLIEHGGHNIIEAAAQNNTIFFGPYMFNFKKDSKYFIKEKAAIQIDDEKELANEILYLLENKEKMKEIENRAKKLVEKNRGACNSNLDILSNLLNDEKKILIVRLSAIGDVIHALPVAKGINESNQNAKISWIVENKAFDLVEMNPYIDSVFKLPKSKWKKIFKDNKILALKKIREFFRNFKRNNFDYSLDLHGLFKSGLTSYNSGSNIRYGPSDCREGSKFFYTNILDLPNKKIHQVDRNLELASLFGAEVNEIDYGLNITKSIDENIKQKARKWNLNLDNLIVINPFTTWESKDWISKRYKKLLEELLKKYNYEIAFTGGPKEKDRIEKIIYDFKDSDRVFNLAAKTNLKELTALYRYAKLFVGGDTGPLHLAAALELPIVAIMGPTDPVTHGPYNKNSIVLQADLECINCWDRKCKRDRHYCMEMIEVKDVLTSINMLLEGK